MTHTKVILALLVAATVRVSSHTIPSLEKPDVFIGEYTPKRRLLDNTIAQFAFWMALNDGNLEGMRDAYDSGANPEAMTEPSHYRPIHLAASIGFLDAMVLLLSYGVDVNAQTINGTTALHYAATHGDLFIIKLLLTVSADPDITNDRGFAPLHYVAYANQEQFEPDGVPAGTYGVLTKEASLESSITAEARSRSDIIGMGEFVACAKVLIVDGGASVNIATDMKEMPLHYTPAFDQFEITLLLIKAGADVNAVDVEGETPLHEATAYGAVGVTQLLLIHGSDPEAKEENGFTPEEFICRCRTYEADVGLTHCAPGKCRGDFDKNVLTHIFDVVLKREN